MFLLFKVDLSIVFVLLGKDLCHVYRPTLKIYSLIYGFYADRLLLITFMTLVLKLTSAHCFPTKF